MPHSTAVIVPRQLRRTRLGRPNTGLTCEAPMPVVIEALPCQVHPLVRLLLAYWSTVKMTARPEPAAF